MRRQYFVFGVEMSRKILLCWKLLEKLDQEEKKLLDCALRYFFSLTEWNSWCSCASKMVLEVSESNFHNFHYRFPRKFHKSQQNRIENVMNLAFRAMIRFLSLHFVEKLFDENIFHQFIDRFVAFMMEIVPLFLFIMWPPFHQCL